MSLFANEDPCDAPLLDTVLGMTNLTGGERGFSDSVQICMERFVSGALLESGRGNDLILLLDMFALCL